VTVGMHTFVGDDDARVRALVAEPVKRYLATFLDQTRNNASVGGQGSTMSDSERETLAQLAFEDMYERRSLLGTPAKCAATARKLATLGVSEIACLIDFGLPFELVLEQLPALAELRS